MDGYDDGTTACPREPKFASADCRTPPLPEGFYDVVYGEGTGWVEIPSRQRVGCTENFSQRGTPDGLPAF